MKGNSWQPCRERPRALFLVKQSCPPLRVPSRFVRRLYARTVVKLFRLERCDRANWMLLRKPLRARPYLVSNVEGCKYHPLSFAWESNRIDQGIEIDAEEVEAWWVKRVGDWRTR